MKFRKIIADPPWAFGDALTMSAVKRGSESNYAVLSIAELLALGPLVSSVCEDDAVLALWFVSAQVGTALQVMTAWGFEQKQLWTWVKTKKDGTGLAFGMGRLARNCTENLLVGTRGKVYRHLKDHGQRNAFFHPATQHSVKPDNVHEMLDTMFPGEPGLELFARRQRAGWTTWGGECPGDKRDIRDVLAHRAP